MPTVVDSLQSADRRRSWAWPLAWFLAGACAFIAAQLLALFPPGRSTLPLRAGAALSSLLSRATGALPIAAGELLLLAYAAWLAFITGRAVRALRARRRTWRDVLAGAARRGLRDAGVLIVVFYALWGLNYTQPPLSLQGGPLQQDDVPAEEWAALAEQATLAANEAYVALHGSTDAGTPTVLLDAARAEAAIDAGWRRAAHVMALPGGSGPWGRVKWPLLSPLIARAGILGVYFPFTGEANVVRGVPGVYATQTMAHEKAHQRGFAREDEAGFLGFVAGALAPDPLSRYGAAMYAHGRLLRPLAHRAPDEYRRIRALRLPGVQRDLDDAAAYFRRHAGLAAAVGSALNDRYLRANRVPGGIRNYGASALLLVAHARANGGRLLPAASPAAR